MQKQTINIHIKEDNKTYNSTENILIWLVSRDGDIFIKRLSKGSEIHPQDLTISADSVKEAIKEVENIAGVLCDNDCLRRSFSYVENFSQYQNYIICTHIDHEHREFILERSKGAFVDFREIMSVMSHYQLTTDSKETLLSLISYLYEKFSFF